MFHPIYSSTLWAIDVDADRFIVRLSRTSTPVCTAAEVDESFAGIRAAIAMLDVRGWGLYFDMRDARPSQDPQIEDAFRRNRK